jgi:hypothetical protein
MEKVEKKKQILIGLEQGGGGIREQKAEIRVLR